MSPYSRPLNSQFKEIRRLLLQPRTAGSEIQCSTEIISLLEQPEYEALSYVWGDASIRENIIFDGALFSVTKNLAVALRHLRLPDQVRRIWVDAICINQSDMKERNEQVAMMNEIYVNAKPVLIFLGEADEGSDEAFGLMSRISDELETDIPEEISQRLFSFYIDFVKREWFTRLWTVQELVLAKQDPIIGCGFTWTTWGVLLKVWQKVALQEFTKMGMVIQKEQEEHEDNNGQLSRIRPTAIRVDLLNSLRSAVVTGGGEQLRDLLLNTVSVNVSEPRDRIYGLLGMMQMEDRESLTVDYGRPLGIVYAEAVAHIFQKGQGPFLLSGMELSGPQPSDISFPSWVPTFGSKSLLSPIRFHPPGIGASGAGSGAVNGTVDQVLKTLRVRGMPIDTVLEKISFSDGKECLAQLSDVEALVEKAHQLAESNSNHRPYLNRFKVKEPVWRTLIANKAYSGASREPAPDSYGEMFQKLLIKKDTDNDDDNGDTSRDYRLALLNHLPRNCFFVTAAGFYGISEKTIKIGDQLAIWFGAPALFVLRLKTDVGNGSRGTIYSVCGVAYVAGIMDGEMVNEIYCEELEDDVVFTVQ